MIDNHTSSDREPAIPASMASFYNTELARKAQEYSKAPLNPLTMFPVVFHYLKSSEESSRSLGVTDKKTGRIGKLFQNESDLWVEIPSQPQTTRCMVASYPNRFYLTPESAEKIARHFLENELRDVAQRTRGSFGAWAQKSKSGTESKENLKRPFYDLLARIVKKMPIEPTFDDANTKALVQLPIGLETICGTKDGKELRRLMREAGFKTVESGSGIFVLNPDENEVSKIIGDKASLVEDFKPGGILFRNNKIIFYTAAESGSLQ